MIDTHAHIYLEQFREDLDEIVEKARQLGITKILMPNIDQTSIDDMLHVEKRFPGYCISMMGLHPCSVGKDFEAQLKIVGDWLDRRKFLAVGEIGTDLYWDKTYFKEQKEAFNQQCEMALHHQLPIVIHCRESIDETISLVKPFAKKGLRGVFHCFTGDVKQASEIVAMDFLLGIGGVVTFKNAGLDKVVSQLRLENLVLETDSPYLAPVPHRGKRNEPAYVRGVVEKLVGLFDKSFGEITDITDRNAKSLFRLMD